MAAQKREAPTFELETGLKLEFCWNGILKIPTTVLGLLMRSLAQSLVPIKPKYDFCTYFRNGRGKKNQEEKPSGNQLQIIRLIRNRLVAKGADYGPLA